MNFTWLIAYLCGAIVAECLLFRLALKRRDVLAARPYAISCLLYAVWLATSALDLATSDLETKILIMQVRLLFVPYLVIVRLEMVYRFVRGTRCITGWILVLALIVPATTGALCWLPDGNFNPYFRHSFSTKEIGGLSILQFERGPWYVVYYTYIYGFNLAAWAVLLFGIARSGWERRPRLLIAVSWLSLALCDILWTRGITWPPNFSYETVLIPITSLVIGSALFRGRIFELAPMVRSKLVDHLADYVIVADANRQVIDLNQSAAKALGCERDSALGRPAAEVLAPWPAVVTGFQQRPQGRMEVQMEDKVFELSCHQAKDALGRDCATVIFLRDFTAQKHAEAEALKALEAAKQADEAKSRFLAMMSHEIRTPMSGILGFSRLLSGTELAPTQRDYIGHVVDCGNSLLVIIDDVLDFAKIEAGQLHLERIGVDLRHLLDSTCSSLAPRAAKDNLQLRWRVAQNLPDVVVGDPVRIRQIVTNLAGNAIKFTERGGVAIDIGLIEPDDDPDGHTIAITVADTGIGISPAALDRIFTPFAQAEKSTTRRYGGTGLGLTITRLLCELMGGDLSATSIPGRGSVFTARIRAGKAGSASPFAPAAAAPTEPALPSVPKRILVFEDNPTNERLIVALLNLEGHQVRTVASGPQGLAMLARGEPFEVILMDLQMPLMDGYMVVEEIRRREPRWNARHHIIALTAHALRGEREKCLRAGMDDYLTKPIDPERLAAAIARAPSVLPIA
jgi:signal transduction histidine kinase/ActR/RegA family two-component response regulator